MALSFVQASTDKVTIPNPQTMGAGSAFTHLLWVKQRAVPGNLQGYYHGASRILAYATAVTAWFINIPRAAASVSRVSDATLFPTLDAWVYLAITYSEASGVRVYRGTLTTTPAEVSYTFQSVGSGNSTAESGSFFLANSSATNTEAPAHDVAFFARYDTEFTLGEIKAHQFFYRPIKAGCRVLMELGFTGTTTQADWSGNLKNGTITGATVSAHAPLRPMAA